MRNKKISVLLLGSAACIALGMVSCSNKKNTSNSSMAESIVTTTVTTTTETKTSLKDATLGITNSLDRVYDGEKSTVDYTNTGDGKVSVKWYKGEEELTDAPADAGNYKVVLTSAETATYKACTLTQEFEISKSARTCEITNTLDRTYDGTASTVEYNVQGDGEVSVKWYKGEEEITDAPTDAGTYSVTVSAGETENYEFCYVTKTFTIAKMEINIDIPDTFCYNGTNLTLPLTHTNTYNKLVSGDEVTLEYSLDGEEEGDHYITAAALVGKDADNYSYDYRLNTATLVKEKIAFPESITNFDFKYDGKEHSLSFASNSYYTVTGNDAQTERGRYIVTVSINNKNKYSWEDGSTGDMVYYMTIRTVYDTSFDMTITSTEDVTGKGAKITGVITSGNVAVADTVKIISEYGEVYASGPVTEVGEGYIIVRGVSSDAIASASYVIVEAN